MSVEGGDEIASVRDGKVLQSQYTGCINGAIPMKGKRQGPDKSW